VAARREEDPRSNEGSSDLVVSTPGSRLPYKAVLSHQGRKDSEHAFPTIREAEAFIRRNTPVPPVRRTLYDRDAS
jgi:hypothetical protein